MHLKPHCSPDIPILLLFLLLFYFFFSAIVRAQRDVQRISFRLGHSSGKRHLEFSLVEKGMNANNVHLKPCCKH